MNDIQIEDIGCMIVANLNGTKGLLVFKDVSFVADERAKTGERRVTRYQIEVARDYNPHGKFILDALSIAALERKIANFPATLVKPMWQR